MAIARRHSPAISINELLQLRSAFTVEHSIALIKLVGLEPSLDACFFSPDVEMKDGEEQAAQLAHSLNGASFDWGWGTREITSASSKMKSSIAYTVAYRSSALLSALLETDGRLKESLDGGGLAAQAALEGADSGHDAVNNVITAVQDLERWAGRMALRYDPGPSHIDVRESDEALSQFIARLGGIYEKTWGKAPGVSTSPLNSGSPSGPFFRFVKGVFETIQIRRSDSAIRTLIKRNAVLKALTARGK